MNSFSRFARAAVGTVNKVYAELVPAVWVSNDGTMSYTGPVLFNEPTERETLGGAEIVGDGTWMEFYTGAFDGLKLKVDQKLSLEQVEINGNLFYVQAVERLFDGKTFKAYLLPIDNGYGPQNQTA